jgi:HlyD family secretion protein
MRLFHSSRLLLVISLALPGGLGAREITLEHKPFSIPASFPATALPANPDCLMSDAKSWVDFRIKSILSHGSRVKKGDALVAFYTEDIDKQLVDLRRAVESGKHSLAQSAAELEMVKQSAPLQLEEARRNRRTAQEDLAYFHAIGRKAAEDRVAESLKQATEQLESAKEELAQLEKMYKANDITDETEEFILKRQRSAVASAELALRLARQDSEHTLKTELPRKQEALDAADRQTALALKRAEETLPHNVRLKELEFDAANTNAERTTKQLADLEADRTLFEVKAPADGWFYHGAIENGRWVTGDAVKSLVPDGHVPPHRPFATMAVATALLGLVAFVDEATARALSAKQTATATPPGREDMSSAATVLHISETPGTDGRWRVDLSAGFPAGLAVAPGMTWEITLGLYHNEQAIVVPRAALCGGADGLSC